jgi:hypothetical protein
MNTINMPGFNAEASLYDMRAPYRRGGAPDPTTGIFPAQFGGIGLGFPGDIGGDDVPIDVTGAPSDCTVCLRDCRSLCRGTRRPPRCYARCVQDACTFPCS